MLVRYALAIMAGAVALASCSEDPVAPVLGPDIPGVFLWTPGDSLFMGRQMQIYAVATGPDSAAVAWPQFTWTSSDSLVAVVDGDGIVHALGPGSTVITAALGAMSSARTVRVVMERADGGVSFIAGSIGTGQHCALTAAGTAYCRTTAPGDSIATYAPLPGATSLSLTELHVTAAHRCGRTAEATLHCWGSNATGQFLNDNRTAPPATGAAGGAGGSLTVGAFTVGTSNASSTPWGHTCVALFADGRVECAGTNTGQVLGRTTTPALPDSLRAPVIGNVRAHALSASSLGSFVCAVSPTSLVSCWGRNPNGATGIGSGGAPRLISASQPFSAVSSGWNHVCALTAEGVAFCWGSNAAGQLGIGTTDLLTHAVPIRVQTTTMFRSIASGSSHTCGITTSAELMCWGDFPPFAMSKKFGTRRFAPVSLVSDTRFVSVTTDDAHVCGITTDGRALCF